MEKGREGKLFTRQVKIWWQLYAAVILKQNLRSTFCTIEASCGLFATEELLVYSRWKQLDSTVISSIIIIISS